VHNLGWDEKLSKLYNSVPLLEFHAHTWFPKISKQCNWESFQCEEMENRTAQFVLLILLAVKLNVILGQLIEGKHYR